MRIVPQLAVRSQKARMRAIASSERERSAWRSPRGTQRWAALGERAAEPDRDGESLYDATELGFPQGNWTQIQFAAEQSLDIFEKGLDRISRVGAGAAELGLISAR